LAPGRCILPIEITEQNYYTGEGRVKKVMLVAGMLLVAGTTGGALAATGKCTVVKVDGVHMVIECNKETRGFAKGNEIKIKSNRKNKVPGRN
jgi:uncharacterized protein YabE (DUF348 family)